MSWREQKFKLTLPFTRLIVKDAPPGPTVLNAQNSLLPPTDLEGIRETAGSRRLTDMFNPQVIDLSGYETGPPVERPLAHYPGRHVVQLKCSALLFGVHRSRQSLSNGDAVKQSQGPTRLDTAQSGADRRG